MKKGLMQKKNRSFSPAKKLIRGITLILLCCLLVRAVAEVNENTTPRKQIPENAETIAKLVISFKEDPKSSLPVLAFLSQSSFLRQNSEKLLTNAVEEKVSATPAGFLYYHPKTEQPKPPEIPVKTETAYTCSDYSTDPNLVDIKNTPGLDIDVAELLAEKPNIFISDEKPSVLIVHTHASEAYTPDGEDLYTESDPYRTEDRNFNVVSLGSLLAEELTKRGVGVIHDTGIYDYPSYAGSYNRTYEVIKEHLEKSPSISIVIDLHRDASEANGSLDYKTTVEINGLTASQVMLVAGTNASGLEHPHWKDNLRFAVHLQASLQSRYPGLARPISISKYRYNQHATTGSLILEIGYCGNTLQEARNAVPLFADAAADVILGIK